MTKASVSKAGKAQKKRLITSALPYVNNAPHLGNIVGCVLSADVFARYSRLAGYETLYICGTDGYGTATETKAQQEGLSPRDICEKYHKIHEAVYKSFHIGFDAFGKTFSPTHTKVVQELFQNAEQAGFLCEQTSEQAYCSQCEKFLADRLVEGHCPKCQYEHARGDQCEACGKLLSPTDLIQPRCSSCHHSPDQKSTSHLYLDLAKLQPQLEAWQVGSTAAGDWTVNAVTTTESWMKQGLLPRPITRDLKWGVPVPHPGYESKVFYVWFDAPIGYISITKAAFPDTWQNWWHDPEGTELYQFMGKDNIPFHSVIFPATLLASPQPWTLLHHLNATEYLNYENDKFSKSKNIGVFGTDVAELPYPTDFWRFYLMRVRPEKQDSIFSWEDFGERVNAELVDNIANLVNRVLVYYTKNFHTPLRLWDWTQDQQQVIAAQQQLYTQAGKHFEALELRDALNCAVLAGKAANRYFQDEEPWKRYKTDPEAVEAIMSLLVSFVRDIAVLLTPFVPETSGRILGWLGVKEPQWQHLGDYQSLVGTCPQKPEILFQKIQAKDMQTFRQRFSGQRSYHAFETLDIRVGQVVDVKPHPDAEHLFVERIELGDRQLSVVSALRGVITAEELLGKKVLVLVNLEPAEFQGITSEGMLLVAATRKFQELPDCEGFAVGSRLQREAYEPAANPAAINFESFKKVDLGITDSCWVSDGQKLLIGGEPVRTQKISRGKIK